MLASLACLGNRLPLQLALLVPRCLHSVLRFLLRLRDDLPATRVPLLGEDLDE